MLNKNQAYWNFSHQIHMKAFKRSATYRQAFEAQKWKMKFGNFTDREMEVLDQLAFVRLL